MATAAFSGNRIRFSYCEVGRAIGLLKEQYAVGTVEIKVVRYPTKENYYKVVINLYADRRIGS